MITMFHQMQSDMKRCFSRISESTDISCSEPGFILNIDLLSYRRVISPKNWMVHDFYEKWMSSGPGECAQKLCASNTCGECASGGEDVLEIDLFFVWCT